EQRRFGEREGDQGSAACLVTVEVPRGLQYAVIEAALGGGCGGKLFGLAGAQRDPETSPNDVESIAVFDGDTVSGINRGDSAPLIPGVDDDFGAHKLQLRLRLGVREYE